MAKFKLTNKVNIGEVLGEGHEQDVLVFEQLTFADAKQLGGLGSAEGATQAEQLEAADGAIEFIKSKFIRGSITDEESGELVELTQEDFDELPITVVKYAMGQLSGGRSEDFTKA